MEIVEICSYVVLTHDRSRNPDLLFLSFIHLYQKLANILTYIYYYIYPRPRYEKEFERERAFICERDSFCSFLFLSLEDHHELVLHIMSVVATRKMAITNANFPPNIQYGIRDDNVMRRLRCTI